MVMCHANVIGRSGEVKGEEEDCGDKIRLCEVSIIIFIKNVN